MYKYLYTLRSIVWKYWNTCHYSDPITTPRLSGSPVLLTTTVQYCSSAVQLQTSSQDSRIEKNFGKDMKKQSFKIFMNVYIYLFLDEWIKCLNNLVMVFINNRILVGQNHRRKIIMKTRSPVLDPPLVFEGRLIGSEHCRFVIYHGLLVKLVSQVSIVIKVLRSKERQSFKI